MRRRYAVLLSALALAAVAAGIVRSGSSRAASADHGRVAAFDLATGALRFDVEAATASVHVHAIGSGVIVLSGADSCHDYPYQGASMYAMSSATGAQRWGRDYQDACFDYDTAAPTTQGVVPVQTRHGIVGWDANDGSTRWTRRTLQSPTGSATIVEAVNGDRGEVTFLDGRSGRTRVEARAPFHPTAWLLTPTTAILETQSDSSHPDFSQRLTALDIRSGRRLWQRTLGRISGFGGPAGEGGVVLLQWSAATHAFSVATGRPLWQHDGILASGSGLALLRDATTLVALDLQTGHERWRAADAPGQIVAGEGAVAVIGDTIRLFDARTGTLRWSAAAPASLGALYDGAAAIGAGALIVPVWSPSYDAYVE